MTDSPFGPAEVDFDPNAITTADQNQLMDPFARHQARQMQILRDPSLGAVGRAVHGGADAWRFSEQGNADLQEQFMARARKDAAHYGLPNPDVLPMLMASVRSPAVHTPPEVTGNPALPLSRAQVPATVGGKSPKDWGPIDFERYGEHFGQGGLGHETPLHDIKLTTGRIARVPESFLGDNRPSYWDQLYLKAQGIDPAELPPGLHGKIHDAMVRGVTPIGGKPGDLDVYNNLVFGMTSGNGPLVPNQIAMQRIKANSPSDIEQLGAQVPWTPEQAGSIKGGPGSDRVTKWSPTMTQTFGLDAEKPGQRVPSLGTSGSVDYTRLADMAQLFQRNPEFFKFRGAHTAEEWANHVQRVVSQLRGIGVKTGSLGTVYQYPAEAQISAMDRHMALSFRNSLFENGAEQKAWDQMVIRKFNDAQGLKGKDAVTSVDQMLTKKGGIGLYGEEALNHLGRHSDKLLRLKGGELNQDIPEALRNTQWAHEPEKVTQIGKPYRRALEANAALADFDNRGLFSQQWKIWDGIRKRLEPHENMNPQLQGLGRMSLPQLRDTWLAHVKAGFPDSPGPVRGGTVRPGELANFSGMPTMPGTIVDMHPDNPFRRDEQ